MKNLLKSMKAINYKLFSSLLIIGIVPTVYTTLRIFFLGQLPGDYQFSIAGQLSWVNLIYEILQEAIILPLFYFIGQVINDKKAATNRIKTGLLITGFVYTLLSALVIVFVNLALQLMAAEPSIIGASAIYIKIESIANIFSMLYSFILVALVTIGKEKYLYIITTCKLILSVFLDVFLVSSLPCSLRLGVNGIGISNIISNIILLFLCLWILARERLNILKHSKMDFQWIKEFAKIGSISGLESLIRNLAYMVMICKMVNVVNEQGTYWVANNFIWGWLLLPVTQLGELIKRDCGADNATLRKRTLGYFGITTIIVALWLILIPVYKPFMSHVLAFDDVNKLFSLVMTLLGFYVIYAYQNIFDSIFYGYGKTKYMLFESVITNTVYYGIAFVLYKTGVWVPTLNGIALLFGIGMAFDGIVSFVAFLIFINRLHLKLHNC